MAIFLMSQVMGGWDILCINCDELFREDLISEHSKLCVEPIWTDVEGQGNERLDRFKCRIEKLWIAMNKTIDNEKDFPNRKELIDLIETARIVTDNCLNNLESLAIIKTTGRKIGVVDQEKLAFSVVVYIERFRVILCELENFLEENIQKHERKLPLENTARLLENMIEFNTSDNLEQVTDDVNEPVDEEDNTFELFSECVNLKKQNYPLNHPVQGINVAKLYYQSYVLDIVPDSWEMFIDAHLKKYNYIN